MARNSIELEQSSCENVSMSGFNITRIINGEEVNIELTSQELNVVKDGLKHECYVSDIVETLKELEDNDELGDYTADEIIAYEEVMDAILSQYAQNREQYNMVWYAAAGEAIKRINIKAYFEPNGSYLL